MQLCRRTRHRQLFGRSGSTGKFGNNFVVQELIHQADVLATLNPSSVNTFRVITYILDDRIHICPIALRLGRSSSDRDNIHYGGVCIGINADGTLKKEAFSEQGEHFVFHPDTKVKFSGYNIGGGEFDSNKRNCTKNACESTVLRDSVLGSVSRYRRSRCSYRSQYDRAKCLVLPNGQRRILVRREHRQNVAIDS